MYHGVYLRSNPRHTWYLVSVVKSAELATQDREAFLQEAMKNGHHNAETAIQTFETSWLIPETLKEIKEDGKQLYN
jgi:hypothetical protein